MLRFLGFLLFLAHALSGVIQHRDHDRRSATAKSGRIGVGSPYVYMGSRDWYTAPEAGSRLGFSAPTIRRMVDSRDLRGFRAPGHGRRPYRVDKAHVDALVEDNHQQEADVNGNLGKLPDWVWNDREFGPALFVLDDPIVRKRAWPHVRIVEREIDFRAILGECYATSELILVGAAMAFWEPRGDCQLSTALRTLNDRPLRRVMLAINLSRGWMTPTEARRRIGVPSSSD